MVVRSYQPGFSGEQFLHHGLFESRVLARRRFQGRDLGVHVGEDSGDGGLFWERRERLLKYL